jgi:hypothetical protein
LPLVKPVILKVGDNTAAGCQFYSQFKDILQIFFFILSKPKYPTLKPKELPVIRFWQIDYRLKHVTPALALLILPASASFSA